jgi:phosphohistidine phosphatase
MASRSGCCNWRTGRWRASLCCWSATNPRLAALLMHGVEADWTVRKGAVWWLAVRERGGQPQVYLKAVMTPDLCAR